MSAAHAFAVGSGANAISWNAASSDDWDEQFEGHYALDERGVERSLNKRW